MKRSSMRRVLLPFRDMAQPTIFGLYTAASRKHLRVVSSPAANTRNFLHMASPDESVEIVDKGLRIPTTRVAKEYSTAT